MMVVVVVVAAAMITMVVMMVMMMREELRLLHDRRLDLRGGLGCGSFESKQVQRIRNRLQQVRV